MFSLYFMLSLPTAIFCLAHSPCISARSPSSLSNAISIFSPVSPHCGAHHPCVFHSLFFCVSLMDRLTHTHKDVFSCPHHTQLLHCTSFTRKNAHAVLHISTHTHTLTNILQLALFVSMCACPPALSTWKIWHLSLYSPSLPPSLISFSLHLSIITLHPSPPRIFNSIPVFLSLLILPLSLPVASPPFCHYAPFLFFTHSSLILIPVTSSFHLVSPFFPLN